MSLNSLHQDPVWQKIEAGLPPEKKPRRWLIFFLLFLALSTGSLVLWNQFKTSGEQVAGDLVEINNTNKTKLPVEENKNSEAPRLPVSEDSPSLKNEQGDKTAGSDLYKRKKATTRESLKAGIETGKTTDLNDSDPEDFIARDPKELKTGANIKINVQAPSPVSDNDESFVKVPVKTEEAGKIKIDITVDTAVVSADNPISKTTKTEIDSVNISSKDKADTTTLRQTVTEKKKPVWQYGISFGSGISTVKNNLFSNAPVFNYSVAAMQSGPPTGPPNPNLVAASGNPKSGVSFNVGFYVERNMNSRWKFNTGLNYLYQSNKLHVGNRVDSAARFDANVYYRPGNSVQYRNQFHFLEIPLLFRYQLNDKSKIYVEAGPTLAYLLYSNAIVYNGSTGIYFTNKDIFNRVLLSFDMGAGINLAQRSKLPFSIGYRFKYGVGSIVKNSFGEQHFVCSRLYLTIPLKK